MPHRPLIGRYPISIALACAMHLIWALGLIMEPGVNISIALHTVSLIGGSPQAAAAVFAAVALCATTGVALRNHAWRVILILPQQVILWVSVVGVAYAIYTEHFPDGTAATFWFLLVDQVSVILITIGHTVAIVFIAREHDG